VEQLRELPERAARPQPEPEHEQAGDRQEHGDQCAADARGPRARQQEQRREDEGAEGDPGPAAARRGEHGEGEGEREQIQRALFFEKRADAERDRHTEHGVEQVGVADGAEIGAG
jgi:hypothetical protein